MSIAENVSYIRRRIQEAAIAAGRDPKDIRLCAATKMNDADAVRQAIAAGVDCCGENRVQELTKKLSENAYEGCEIHFIGHLQTNKVRQVVGKVSLIHSIDSIRLLEAVNLEAGKQGIRQDILLEVNAAGEQSKSGFALCDILPLVEKLKNYPHIRLRGLMTIPPICQKKGDNDKFFQEIRSVCVDIMAKTYDNVSGDILSMGMSDDYQDAIRCGSTMIRLGTAIFGPRDYTKTHQN